MIDKLDPLDYESAFGSKYLGNVDMIEEELSAASDEGEMQPRSRLMSSQSSGSRGRNSLLSAEPINPLSYAFFRNSNYRTSKSLVSPVE